MRRNWLVLVAALAGAVGLTAVLAGAGMHARPHGHDRSPEAVNRMVEDTLDDLGATDAQRAKVLAVKDRLLVQVHGIHGHHEAVHGALLRGWESDTMDTSALHGMVDAKVEELRAALHATVDGVAEIHETLTPDQRRRLAVRVKEMHGSP